MLETLLKLLQDLPDWEVYREVAAALDGEELVAWRRLYDAKPEREFLVREAVRVLGTVARERYPDVVNVHVRVNAE